MNTYFQNLMDELNEKITTQSNSFNLNLEQVKQYKVISVESLEKLEHFSKTYKFKSEEEEIHYYKNLKPKLVAEIIYYCRVAMIIGRIPMGSIEAKQDHFKNELKKIEAFFQIYDSISGKAISPNDSCNIVSVMLFGRDYGLRRLDVKNTLFAYYILQQQYKNRELINYSIIEKGH